MRASRLRSGAVGATVLCTVLTVMVIAGTASAQAPDLEACSAPGLAFGGEFGDPPTVQDIITVADDDPTADLHVLMEISHTFVGDILLDLSHDGTTVRLHDGGGGGGSDIDVIYDDEGAANGSEPYDCGCQITPAGPGSLDDLIATGVAEEWVLDVEDQFPFSDDGVLERWCLQLYQNEPPQPPPPIQNLFCQSPADSGVVQAAWTNPIAYDEFRVFLDGDLVAVLPGFFFGYVSPPQSIPSLVDLTVVGVIGGVEGPPRTCTVAVLSSIDLVLCEQPGAIISSGSLPVVSPIVVADDMPIGDLQVKVDIEHTFIGDLQISLTSPAQTTVWLHDNDGGADQNIQLTYWEFGVPNGSVPYDCECFVEPSGPGLLLDFVGESALGTWNFLVVDIFAGDSGILNEWCFQAFENMPVFPVDMLTCTSGTLPGTAELSWTNALPYDEIDILVDGVLEATLPGPFVAGGTSSYTTLALPAPGEINICVVPRLGGVEGPQRCCDQDVFLAGVESLVVTSFGGSGEATATWSNPLPYDAIEVAVNGGGTVTLPGDSTSFTASGIVPPAAVTFCVRGIQFGFGPSPDHCGSTMVLDSAVVEVCSTPTAPVSSTLPPVNDVVEVVEGLIALDVEVSVSLTHTFIGDLSVELFAPTGTGVRLHDQGGAAANDILLAYTDAGVPNGSVPYDCGCLMQPSGAGGVGTLADFSSQVITGDWTLTVIDHIDQDEGELMSWCLRITEACDLLPPTDLTCFPESGAVTLDWVNGAPYDDLEVLRDGDVIAVLPGSATSFTDDSVSPGSHEYRVAGLVRSITCPAPSQPCRVAFGITDVIYRGELPSNVDSVTALQTALEQLGHVALVVDVLDATTVMPPESAVGTLWVMLGTFPDNRSLTMDEGLLLAELNTGDVGLDGQVENDPLPIYIEGGDVWGFDAPTPFADYDGVDNDTALDGDDSLSFLTGLNSLVGLELGDGTWDAPYLQDQFGNDYTDRIEPAVVTPDLGGSTVGAIWRRDDDVDPYEVGIFYASSFAPVIAQSFELGGYDGNPMLLVGAYRGALLGTPPEEPPGDPFRRGDAEPDGIATITDPILILQFLFLDGVMPPCPDAADFDDNGSIALADAILELNWLFTEGAPPPATPGPDTCGPDPVADGLPACVYDAGNCP